MRAVNQPTWMLVDEFVAAFERARAVDAAARLADYLPPADNPLYLPVLSELVRVDLEDAWDNGEPRRVEAYRNEFPRLFGDPARLAEVAFEEYRLRHLAGEPVSLSDYRSRYGVDWPTASARRLGAVDGDRSGRVAERLSDELPAVGSRFLDFQLLRELGQGAFGRVYLAAQGELACRYVVLKISARHWTESQTLARLQHANIVPIYSYHRRGPLHAVCMPFFGATTLADVIGELAGRAVPPDSGKALVDTVGRRQSATRRPDDDRPDAPDQDAPRTAPARVAVDVAEAAPSLRRLGDLSYIDAVLWIGVQLADGLAHAHERGVVHRDLKPANILLSDDGQPMLLDFNLSADASLAAGADPLIGGTLPYMAPEQLEALQRGVKQDDPRGDLYSLGVVLYELLSGRLPFAAPRGPWRETIEQMIADRRGRPSALGQSNRAVSPAVESILARCLEADVAQRYQSAEELREDLTRQLDSRPLKHAPDCSWPERFGKWRRRHKQLASVGAVVCAAAVAIALLTMALVVRGGRLERLAAADSLQSFLADVKAAQFELNQPELGARQTDAGVARCRGALARFQIIDSDAWQSLPEIRLLDDADQARLADAAAEALLVWTRTLLQKANAAPDSPAIKADLELAKRLNALAQSCYVGRTCPRAVVLQQAEIEERLDGKSAHTDDLRRIAAELPLADARDLFLAATEQLGKHAFGEAIDSLEQATQIDPQRALAWLALGHCHFQQGDFARATACYGTCIALEPAAHWAYFDRGLAHLHARDFRRAKLDFDRAIGLHGEQADAWVDRGLAELELGDAAAAIADFTRAIELKTTSTRVYFMRAKARELAGDRAGAAADRSFAMSQQPTDETSWVSRGVAQLAADPQAALADFEQALVLNPQSRAALEDKAHVLAERLGRTAEAVAALDRVIALYPEYAVAYAGRGVLLARLGRFGLARRDAREALVRDASPPTMYRAACVYALASAEDPNRADDEREAFRLLSSALRGGFGMDVIEVDPDIAPLRKHPEYRQLVLAAQTLIRRLNSRETR